MIEKEKIRARCRFIYPVTLGCCALLLLVAFNLDGPARVWEGLKTICLTQDVLVTDYVALGGLGAALANSALVVAASVAVLWLTKAPLGGHICSTLGLMAGFSLFGKDILNIWPIVLGSLLFAALRREPVGRYAHVGLMASCLAPIVSALWFSGHGWVGGLAGTLVGLGIGMLLPLLSLYTGLLLRGMNLYNVGFACGLASMMIVPVMCSAHVAPETVLIWGTGYNTFFTALLLPLFVLAIVAGIVLAGGLRPAWAGYRRLLQSTGRPSEFLLRFGASPVLINMGLSGLMALGYILLIDGDLNGPTVGGILTIVGFAANGKHPGNMIPLIFGLALGGWILPGFSVDDPSIQFCALFVTTLAPLCGTFGPLAGVLAGFLHGCLVQRTGSVVVGLNLYNNGFTGGVVSIVLYPVLVLIRRHRLATLGEDLEPERDDEEAASAEK